MKIKQLTTYLIALFIVMASTKGVVCAATDTWFANGDATVTDHATGRVWQQEDDEVLRSHAEAISYCNNLTLGGSDVWRLPSIKELTSIVDYRTNAPAINKTSFTNTDGQYWSSTNRVAVLGDTSYWVVNFASGSVSSFSENFNLRVRCVKAPSLTIPI